MVVFLDFVGGSMDERFLGDSYDLVKRFWAESLRPIGELYADIAFVPEKLREKFRVPDRGSVNPSPLGDGWG